MMLASDRNLEKPMSTSSVAARSGPSLRERKHLRARQSILEEATRLFLTKGYSSTTLRDIADAAETSVATIVRYFVSKDAILLYRERAIISKLADRVRAGSYRTLGEGVRDAVWTSLLDLPERDRLFDIILTDPGCVPLIAAIRRDWEAILEDLFVQFSPDTPEGRLRAKSLAAMQTAAGMAGMQFWHETGKEHDLRTMQEALIDDFIVAFVEPIERSHVGQTEKSRSAA